MDDAGAISARKLEHLQLATSPSSQSELDPGWPDVHLVPSALPELSLADLDLGCTLAGRPLRAPVVIASMTGGHEAAAELNATLGEAAAELGIAIGVGSQRAALVDPQLAPTFAAVRSRASGAFVIGNIGAVQLVAQGGHPALRASDIERVVEMVGADALAIHLNVVQELLQPEGDRNTGPLLDALRVTIEACPVPVIVKETGGGVDRESAVLLAGLVPVGLAAIDVGGAGGTSFAAIESTRAGGEPSLFADWGIPTAASLLECRGVPLPLIATGGIDNGLDAAKALALGASLVGVGRFALLAAQSGTASLVDALAGLLDDLRTAMVLTGARTPVDLAVRAPVVTGFTLEWARQRGLLP